MITYTRNKFITNFTACDKMMIQVTKTLTILCLMMFHSTKSKNDLIFGFSTSKNSWKTLSFSNSYAHTHQKLNTNQLYSSDQIMVHITKTHIVLCLMIFHSTKSKNDLIFRFSTLKQLSLSVIHMLTLIRN